MSALRFFFVVSGPGALYYVAAAGVVSFAVYLAVTGLSGFNPALPIVLLLQLFAASTGYRDKLRRGHFDPILVARASFASIALSHWLISIGLGVAAWLFVSALDAIREHAVPDGLTYTSIALLLYTSTIVWLVSLPFGRHSGGVLWLVLLFGLASTHQLQDLRAASTIWAGLVCPLFLLGPSPPEPLAILALAVGTAVAWIAGAFVIRSFQAVLVEA